MPAGIGGHLTLPGVTPVDVRLEEWSIQKQIESADTTDSGSNFWRDREALLKDATGTANAIWRIGTAFEDLSLDIGDTVLAVFRLGSTAMAYTGLIHVKSISTTNPGKGNDVIKQQMSWEHVEDGIAGPLTYVAALMLAEQMYNRLMKQAEEDDAHTERVMQQWQERLEEVQRGQVEGQRVSQRRTWQRQFERRNVSGQSTNGGNDHQPAEVGTQTAPAEQTKGTPGDRPGDAGESPRSSDRNPQTPPGQAKP